MQSAAAAIFDHSDFCICIQEGHLTDARLSCAGVNKAICALANNSLATSCHVPSEQGAWTPSSILLPNIWMGSLCTHVLPLFPFNWSAGCAVTWSCRATYRGQNLEEKWIEISSLSPVLMPEKSAANLYVMKRFGHSNPYCDRFPFYFLPSTHSLLWVFLLIKLYLVLKVTSIGCGIHESCARQGEHCSNPCQSWHTDSRRG